MKPVAIILSLALVVALGTHCTTSKPSSGCYKGRLEIKALCMNYTIKVLEGNIDTSLISATWTDSSTNKTYQNVFGLGSRCDFPPDIQQGDEFYFVLNKNPERGCATCLAYYPTPPKKLDIKISRTPCR